MKNFKNNKDKEISHGRGVFFSENETIETIF